MMYEDDSYDDNSFIASEWEELSSCYILAAPVVIHVWK